MKLDHLLHLQKELSTFLISIFIASILIVVSNTWLKTAYNNRSDAKAELNVAKNRYYTALQKKHLIKLFATQYNQLKASGIVGHENRLNWVNAIEKITSSNKIPYLKYKINKRQTFTSDELTKNYPGIILFKSNMTLQMQLLHEGDLYNIINSLYKTADGLFDIQSCTIKRKPTQLRSLLKSTTDRNFSAICNLNWYTIQTKNIRLEVAAEI